MSNRGRPRKWDPTIPSHVDQLQIPKGCYWDRRDRVWYTLRVEGPRTRRLRIAGKGAKLSELHTRMEELGETERGTLIWLCDLFHESAQFRSLAKATQDDYTAQHRLVEGYAAKVGTLGKLAIARLTSPFLQRITDRIGEVHPSKAAHLVRYLSRVFNWGRPRGYCTSNPAEGLEKPRERKQRRLPTAPTHAAILAFARKRFTGYLWMAMELAYLMRLRGIEVLTLADDNADEHGVRTNRRKGSRDVDVLWSPRLRAVWQAALDHRTRVWSKKRFPTPLDAAHRHLLVNDQGQPIRRGALDTLWRNMMIKAIEEGVIAAKDRFGIHDLKRKGITDTTGTRAEKREASGHRSESMMDVYDLSVPKVTTPGGV